MAVNERAAGNLTFSRRENLGKTIGAMIYTFNIILVEGWLEHVMVM